MELLAILFIPLGIIMTVFSKRVSEELTREHISVFQVRALNLSKEGEMRYNRIMSLVGGMIFLVVGFGFLLLLCD